MTDHEPQSPRMRTERPHCHVCLDLREPVPHHPEDCPEWDGPDWYQSSASVWTWRAILLVCLAAWGGIWLLTITGILDAIDAWRAPWQ